MSSIHSSDSEEEFEELPHAMNDSHHGEDNNDDEEFSVGGDDNDPSVNASIMDHLSDGSEFEGESNSEPEEDNPEPEDDNNVPWQPQPPPALITLDGGGLPQTGLPADYNNLVRNYIDTEEHWQDLQRTIQRLQDISVGYQQTIRSRDAVIRDLQARIAGVRPIPVLWSTLLRSYLNGNAEALAYNDIRRKSCKQENTSMTLEVFHPDFNLQMEPISPESESYMSQETPLPPVRPLHPPLLEPRPFPFERLPPDVQTKIFRRVFVRRSLVHCLSRLDPFVPPQDFPQEDEPDCSQLPKRFHFGTSPCQIRRARKPNDFLRPLLVCKRWFFIGVHAFYGANTFAFSSLGEWHRFCNGIGAARVERLVNVEIMWHGALMPVQNPQLSLRSIGLAWFTKTRRLRTLGVHISESASWRRRRGNETWERKDKEGRITDRGTQWNERPNGGLFDDDGIREDSSDDAPTNHPKYLLNRRTARQPNSRKYRSMRTIQGMDYIYQLRDMKWVRFMETDGKEHRQRIRDWSFHDDVNKVTSKRKQPNHALKSELENLTSLSGLVDWIPTDVDTQIIESFYDETPTADDVGGSDTSESEDGSFGDDDDGGSDSSGGSDGPRSPHGPNHGDGAPDDSDHESDDDSAPSNGDRMDVDNSSSSSGLFVREGSGSPESEAPVEEPMDLDQDQDQDQDQQDEISNGDASEEAKSDDNLFVSSGSGSPDPSSGSGSASSRIVIDLTGYDTEEEDGDESSSEHSRASSAPVKSEGQRSNDENLNNQINDMTIDDDDIDFERGFVREESPPDSDDESDIDMGSDLIDSTGSQSPSSKRGSEDGGSSSPPKRPRFD